MNEEKTFGGLLADAEESDVDFDALDTSDFEDADTPIVYADDDGADGGEGESDADGADETAGSDGALGGDDEPPEDDSDSIPLF